MNIFNFQDRSFWENHFAWHVAIVIKPENKWELKVGHLLVNCVVHIVLFMLAIPKITILYQVSCDS